MSKTAMKIEMVDIETLIPYARNARTHSEQQVTQIAASIREFGFNNPVLIDIQPRKWSGQQVQTADRPEHTQSEKGIEHV